MSIRITYTHHYRKRPDIWRAGCPPAANPTPDGNLIRGNFSTWPELFCAGDFLTRDSFSCNIRTSVGDICTVFLLGLLTESSRSHYLHSQRPKKARYLCSPVANALPSVLNTRREHRSRMAIGIRWTAPSIGPRIACVSSSCGFLGRPVFCLHGSFVQ